MNYITKNNVIVIIQDVPKQSRKDQHPGKLQQSQSISLRTSILGSRDLSGCLLRLFTLLLGRPLVVKVTTLGIDLNSVCTKGSLTFTVPHTLLSRLPLSPLNLVSRLRWPLQTFDLDPSFNSLCFLVPISYIFVVSVLGQSWLVFISFTVVNIYEWLKKCYAQYALDFYQIKLLSLDKFFQKK